VQPSSVAELVFNLLIVLAAGLVAGVAAKRLGISMLVGYLVVGTLLGAVGFGPMTEGQPGLEYLAQAGALLLLFSIGIEFSMEELRRLSRFFFLGGSLQMLLVAAPIVLLAALFGFPWTSAILIGSAVALSSTVLVFKALEEWGQTASGHGRRAIGILLFQDVALVPLMLLVPMLTGKGPQPGWQEWVLLAAKSALFIAVVLSVREIIARWLVAFLAELRSVELLLLFALIVLGGASLAAYAAGFPAAMGALAAGVALNGNRLSGQFDALILPYRETFAAVFFVSLGTLMHFGVLWDAPLITLGGLLGVLLLKTAAAAITLKVLGLTWRVAWAFGLGLSQLGELSFVLLSEGVGRDVISPLMYNRMLFIALGTLILTPQLLRTGLRWAEEEEESEQSATARVVAAPPVERALVVGLGPIGSQVASQLEIHGRDVCLIDLSPVNLHPYAQQGFRTIAGDGSDPEILHRADIDRCRLAVVTVPDDEAARQVVSAIRLLNPACTIVVRCRYQANAGPIRRAGANTVISEEAEAGGAIVRLLGQIAPGPESRVES
jgi:CPA2 family monovalent cation:H+ antiporter-2